MIEIRQAQQSDKARIEEISSKIWDGDDYVPLVFDKWVTQENGEFSVVTVDGVVAGCTKITELPNKVLWLEGIRVDTDYRGKGLGRELAKYQISRSKEMGYSRLELSTFVENYESIAIIEKNGFRRVASFKFLMHALENQGHKEDMSLESKAFRCITNLDEARPILDLINTEYRQSYINLDWTFLKCDEDLLKELLSRNMVYKYKDSFFAFGNWGQKDDGMTLYFMFGPHKEEIIGYILHQAQKNNCSNVIIMSDGGTKEHEILYKHGFMSFTENENDAFVYRYKE
tara:strand:+ start:83 stop:940 length:858 start_codon:yes stop_codon:yes gene_type:complete